MPHSHPSLTTRRFLRGSYPRSRAALVSQHRFSPCLENLEGRTLLSSGDLDTTFGALVPDNSHRTGKLTVDIHQNDYGNRAVVEANGSIVVPGTSDYGGYLPARGDIALIGLTSQGEPDYSFGSIDPATGLRTGRVVTDIGATLGLAPSNEGVQDVLKQSDGSILVAGTTKIGNDPRRLYVIRYLANGDRDPAFGGGLGWVTVKVADHEMDTGFLAVQSEGTARKILVTGLLTSGDGSEGYVLAKFNDDGSPDTSFGLGGVATLNVGSLGNVSGLWVRSDGEILVAGGPQFKIQRFTQNGTPDGIYSDGGAAGGPVYGGTLLADDSLLVLGNNHLERVTKEGQMDHAFGTDGIVTLPLLAGGVAIQPNGKIVIAGNVASMFAITRLNGDGSVDRDFGVNGLVKTAFGANSQEADKVTVQPDGKIVATGAAFFFANSILNVDFAIARFEGDTTKSRDLGSLPNSVTITDDLSSQAHIDYSHFVLTSPSDFFAVPLTSGLVPDIELLDASGQRVVASEHGGAFSNSISRVLQAGSYTIHVYPHSADAYGSYKLNLGAPALADTPSRIGGIVTRDGTDEIDHVAISQLGKMPIKAPLENTLPVRTWLVIHGRNDNPLDADIQNLATAIDGYSSDDQVLLLDWTQGAGPHSGLPEIDFTGANWITPVGEWAAHVLSDLGISHDLIDLVGHSWGSYVAYEIANALPQHVHTIVALDPARPSDNQYDTSHVVFSTVSSFSWAFEGSFAGNEATAATARESFAVYAPDTSLNPLTHVIQTHANVMRLFTSMVYASDNTLPNSQPSLPYVSHYFNLYDLLHGVVGPWAPNSLPTYSYFEAVIRGKLVDSTWMPASIQFIQTNPRRAVRESTSPDSHGRYVMTDSINSLNRAVATIGRLNGAVTYENWVGFVKPVQTYVFVLDSSLAIRAELKGGKSRTALLGLLYHFDKQGKLVVDSSFDPNGTLPKMVLAQGTYYIDVSYLNLEEGYRTIDPDNPYQLTVSATSR